MKIAILGAGTVGSTLGTRWAEGGHDVVFGVRDPGSKKVQTVLAGTAGRARAARPASATEAAEVVVLAVPWGSAQDALAMAGDLHGKILVDCTNPVVGGGDGLAIGHTTSAGEQIAAWASGARVVKAFNTTGAGNMADPVYGEERLTMFVCGHDDEARAVVLGLAEELGFEGCDAGPLRAARYLEPLAMLWIHLAYVQGDGPRFGFRVVRR